MTAVKENKVYRILDNYLLTGFNFKALMIVITMLTSVPYLHYKLGGYVKFVLAYGILVCVWQVFQKRTYAKLRLKPSVLLCLFAVLYLITVFVNKELYFERNLQQLVYMSVFFFLMYIDMQLKPAEEIQKDIHRISLLFIIITFVFACICFYTFLRQFHYLYVVPTSHAYYRFGISENRLWGLYNPNTGSTINVLSILFTFLYVGTMQCSKKRIAYIVGATNVILQYWCMILTDSRTAYYGLTIVLALLAGFAVFRRQANNSIIKKLLAVVLVMLVTVVFIFTVTDLMEVGLTYLPGIMTNIFGDSFSLSGAEPGGTVHWLRVNPISLAVNPVDVNRLPESGSDFLTGRTQIWVAGLEVFKDNPILGIGREGIAYVVPLELSGGVENSLSNDIYTGGLHNMYLTVLVCSGAVGFIVFMVFIFINVFSALKELLVEQRVDLYLLMTFAVTVFFLISEMFEARILYQVSIFNVLFWCTIGYLFALIGNKQSEVVQNG